MAYKSLVVILTKYKFLETGASDKTYRSRSWVLAYTHFHFSFPVALKFQKNPPILPHLPPTNHDRVPL